ncbi:MAG: LEA type 2 family protein [Phycisphaerales bacterium]
MTRRPLALALLALALALPGCVGGAPPTFSLERVVRTETAPTAATIDFIFEGANPTRNAYPLREVAYSVRIDGQTVFEGVRSAQVTLPPNDARRFRIPAPIPYDAVGRLAGRTVEYQVSGSVAYLPPGPIAEILYDLGIQRRRVPFSDGGLLEIPPDDELPEFLRLNPDEAGAGE